MKPKPRPNRAWLLVVASLLAIRAFASEPKTYSDGFIPKPPAPFPAQYDTYQILPGTVSPDHRYAFIYPKRLLLYELPKPALYLVALNPFHLLTPIPTGYSNLAENVHGYYVANWAKDSSAATFIAGAKWGPEKVIAAALRDGKATHLSDLTEAVRQLVQSDFKASGAEPFNEYHDFVFESEGRYTSNRNAPDSERGWDPDGQGHILIDCTCTTDPKDLDPKGWTIRFHGTWDIEKEHFLKKDFHRIPPQVRDE